MSTPEPSKARTAFQENILTPMDEWKSWNLLESILTYCEYLTNIEPKHEDGHTDGIAVGLQMAAKDIMGRFEQA